MNLCQACRNNSVDVVDDCDNANYPYRVCDQCHNRIVNLALRPREYFNLASQHGMTYLLHDDFYDENGVACQPGIKVDDNPSLSFPELNDLHDLKSLVDYAVVQWWLTEEVVDSFEKFSKDAILDELDTRINANRTLSSRIYELAAKTIGRHAGYWILEEWELRSQDTFLLYADALAKCLSLEHGFQLFSAQLEKIEQPSKLSQSMTGLIHFQSKLGLSWIENNIKRVSNISDSWGYVAVASEFDWGTAKKWLEHGRPLSLIALDALANCATTSTAQNSTIWLRDNPQKLLRPATIAEMNEILMRYGKCDQVPRVRSNINFIIANWDDILKNE